MTPLELTGRLISLGNMQINDFQELPADVPRAMFDLPNGRVLLLAGLTRDECRALADRFGGQLIITLREQLQGTATKEQS